MPTAYILVGVPAAGKSTWIKNQKWARDCVLASTDDYIEDVAAGLGKTYNEVFEKHMPDAMTYMVDVVLAACEEGKDIIWDQTSVSVKSRKKKFNMLPGYTMIAVVFPTPPEEEWNARLASRPGKSIPSHVLKSMSESFEMPTTEEGFDQVWIAG